MTVIESFSPVRALEMGSGAGALEHQLHLTHGSPADVEASPADSQKDGGEHQNQAEVHDSETGMGRSYGNPRSTLRPAWAMASCL